MDDRAPNFRRCCRCKELKPLAGFPRNRSKPLGRTHECYECNRAYQAVRYVPRPRPKPDISRLGGYVSEPYLQNRVLAACRTLPGPFILREAVQASGLPAHKVRLRLERLVKKGILSRSKANVACKQMNLHTREWIPGGRVRSVYLYSFVEDGE